MAKRTRDLITETKNDFSRLQEQLESAKATRDKYNRELRNARERLKRREETTLPTKLAEGYIKSIKQGNVLKAMMMAAIDKAVEVNGEFRAEAYKEALYSVAGEMDIYKMFIIGTGWATKIVPSIVFEEAAGDLTDWASAVKSYRTDIKTKRLDDEEAGEKASEWWFSHVYSTALETKTIKGRLSHATGKAPFWQILAYGTPSTMDSDRPGGYTNVPATRTSDTVFVENVEFAIREAFEARLNQERQVYFEEEQELRNLISEYEQRRDEYSAEVDSLRTDMRLNERILKSFKDKEEYVDRDILAKAIKSVDDNRRKRTETVNIAKQGSGLELLITIRRAEGEIEY